MKTEDAGRFIKWFRGFMEDCMNEELNRVAKQFCCSHTTAKKLIECGKAYDDEFIKEYDKV